MKVKYTGTADFQGFDKADFTKAGIDDQGKVMFAKGEPLEVSDAAGALLISKDAEESPLFYGHSFEEVVEEKPNADLKGKALEEAVDEANAQGANISSGLTADEKREALAAFNSPS